MLAMPEERAESGPEWGWEGPTAEYSFLPVGLQAAEVSFEVLDGQN